MLTLACTSQIRPRCHLLAKDDTNLNGVLTFRIVLMLLGCLYQNGPVGLPCCSEVSLNTFRFSFLTFQCILNIEKNDV